MQNILVVEDDQSLLDLYRMELEDEGYKIFCARDGEDAIRIAKKSILDLVILDIRINKIEGLEVLKEIKRIKKDLPVILNTAYSTYKLDFASWMADAYIVKSSKLDELKEKIRELLKIE